MSEDLFPRLPNLRTFTFLEGCPTFPLSSFNEFATLKVQRHMLDHWEQVGLPGSLSEVSFTSSVKWSKRGRDWVPRSAVGEFKQWEIGIQPAVASIRIDWHTIVVRLLAWHRYVLSSICTVIPLCTLKSGYIYHPFITIIQKSQTYRGTYTSRARKP